MVETSPQWPPASVPCATMMSTPGGDLAHGVLPGADQGGAGDAGLPGAFQHRGGRHAERVGDQPDRVAEGDVHQLLAGLELVGRRAVQVLPARGAPGRIDVVTAQQVVDEGAVLLRNARPARSPRVAPASVRTARFSGISRSTPYGLPSMWASIQASSVSSCSGV